MNKQRSLNFLSFRRKGRRDAKDRPKTKRTHIVLLDAQDSSRLAGQEPTRVPVLPVEKKKKRKTSSKNKSAKAMEAFEVVAHHESTSTAPVTQSQSEKNLSKKTSARALWPFEKETKERNVCYVRCPLGLDEGNTMMVISPCGKNKFPVKIPKGVVCGQEFAVPMPDRQDNEQNAEAHQEEGSFDYVWRVVDEFLTPTPSLEEGEQQQNAPSPLPREKDKTTKKHKKKNQGETTDKTDMKANQESEDFSTALDSFFTPVPEVKAYYHAASA